MFVRNTVNRAGSLEVLTEINLEDLFRAFAIPGAAQSGAARVLRPFARRFAETLLTCDGRVKEVGLQRAMQETLSVFGATLVTEGLESLPVTGPLIVASNHPGLTDAAALFAALERPDLMVLSAQSPLLGALPAIHERLIYVDEASPFRTVRRVGRHLRAGGALLTFPAGRIEPDPALDGPGAERSVGTWSDSIELFCRLEPRTTTVPVVVSGVTTPAARSHPLTLLHRDPDEKAWLAACLQVMFRRYRNNRVVVRFGPPLLPRAAGGRPPFSDLPRSIRLLVATAPRV